MKIVFNLALVAVLVSSCANQKKDKMNSKYADRPQVLEVLSFEKTAHTPSESVLESMRSFVVEMNKYDKLPRKVVANDGSKWISVNYWEDIEGQEKINEEASTWESSKAFGPKLDGNTYAMASYSIDYSDDEDVLSKGDATVLEYVFMKKSESASIEDVQGLLHSFTPQMNQFGGLMDRVIAHDENGNFVCVNYWRNLQEMEKINSMAASFEGFSDFPKYADMSSMSLSSYYLRPSKANNSEVIEIAVRSVKEDMKKQFENNRERFIAVWMDNDGANVDREFESVFGIPNTDNEKFIGMTAWAGQEDFAKAGQTPEVGNVAPDFMGTFDMLAFVTAKPVEGDFNLASLIQEEGQLLELAVRRIKDPEKADEFHKLRKAYVEKLGNVEGVLASYEFEVVMSGIGEHITVGMTEYANQEAVDRAGATVNQGPEAAAFQEAMEVVTFNYLKKVK